MTGLSAAHPAASALPPPQAVAPRIEVHTARELDALGILPAVGTTGDEFTRVIDAAVRGGKRVRGYLAFVGWALARGVNDVPGFSPIDEGAPGVASAPDHPLDILAGALELYQASALVHDDVIDHADTRRARPTTHVVLAGDHREHGWVGDAAAFGTAGAILAGDLLLSAADHAVAAACRHLAPEAAAAVLERFTVMHAEVAIGQYLDVRAEQVRLDPNDPTSLSVDDALHIARLKSARYSVVHPTALGVLAGQGDASLVRVVEEIVEPWGLAFQLRDDDLGVFGDPDLTGKPAGDDLREGKRTVLLALAWERATIKERRLLARGLERSALSPDAVSRMTDVVNRRGRSAHEAVIADLVAQGDTALRAADLDAAQRSVLGGLGDLLTVRAA